MAADYPKKYWWVVLVVVPIVGAIIAVSPDFFDDKGEDPIQAETPEIKFFKASKSRIHPGESVTLSWDTEHVTGVALNNIPVELDGEEIRRPESRTQFVLSVQNAQGETAKRSLEVDVVPLPAPQILSFEASPASINTGESTNLSWDTRQAANVTINDKPVALKGNRSYSPETSTTYTLTATNKNGLDTRASVEVTVIPPPAEILGFSAEPSRLDLGKTSLLSWQTRHARTVTLNGESVTIEGQKFVAPPTTTTYELAVTDAQGNLTATTIEIEVIVPPPPTIVFMEANPPSVQPNEPSVLRWSTTDATTVTLNGSPVDSLGQLTVYPQTTTRYRLKASNASGQSKETDTSVQVIQPPKIEFFGAQKLQLFKGEETRLSWRIRDASDVRLNGASVPISGSQRVRPQNTTEYVLTARKGSLSDRATLVIAVDKPVVRSLSETLLASLDPVPAIQNVSVQEAIRSVIDSNNPAEAKMLMSRAGYADGINLILDLDRFETAGGTVAQGQRLAAKLWEVGIKLELRR